MRGPHCESYWQVARQSALSLSTPRWGRWRNSPGPPARAGRISVHARPNRQPAGRDGRRLFRGPKPQLRVRSATGSPRGRGYAWKGLNCARPRGCIPVKPMPGRGSGKSAPQPPGCSGQRVIVPPPIVLMVASRPHPIHPVRWKRSDCLRGRRQEIAAGRCRPAPLRPGRFS